MDTLPLDQHKPLFSVLSLMLLYTGPINRWARAHALIRALTFEPALQTLNTAPRYSATYSALRRLTRTKLKPILDGHPRYGKLGIDNDVTDRVQPAADMLEQVVKNFAKRSIDFNGNHHRRGKADPELRIQLYYREECRHPVQKAQEV